MRSLKYYLAITVLVGAVLTAAGLGTQYWPEITGWLTAHGIHP